MPGLIQLLITLLVFGVICYLVFWVMGTLGVPAPIVKVVTVIIVVIAVIWLLNNFLPMAGSGAGTRHGLWW